MNWEAIGAVGEIVGAAGVILTLGYLAMQIRQNTRALGSTAAQSVSSTAVDITFRILENPDLSATFEKTFGGTQSLSASERFRMNVTMRALFRTIENQFYQNEQGFLVQLWPGYHHNLSNLLRVPFVRDWWPGEKNAFGPAFRDFVDRELLATSKGSS